MFSSARAGAAVIGAAGLLSIALASCSGTSSSSDAGDQQAPSSTATSGSGGPQSSATATGAPSASSRSTSPPDTADSSEQPGGEDTEAAGELGPTAVRVLHVAKGATGGVRVSVVGPEGARYRLRTRAGLVESCTQEAGAVDATPLPGLPVNAVRHAELKCGAATSVREVTGGTLTVSGPAGPGFTYTFEVPARPAT